MSVVQLISPHGNSPPRAAAQRRFLTGNSREVRTIPGAAVDTPGCLNAEVGGRAKQYFFHFDTGKNRRLTAFL
jgi:hypothetical protein